MCHRRRALPYNCHVQLSSLSELGAAASPGLCRACGSALSDFGLGWQCAACLLAAAIAEEADGSGGMSRFFGEYELQDELGRGGMGTVYRAGQPSLARAVALKMLPGGVFARPSFLARFQREALAAARLRHPGIAVVHEAGEVDGIAYYTMELLEGGSLAGWIASERRQPRAVAALLEKIARAVAFAHEHGVLHRDLKPSNILLTAAGEPKVADFGLARLVEEAEDGAGRLTLTQGVLGTPAYMAPEVAAGEPASISSDVYALGAILHEALTGQPPHTGPNTQAVLARALGAGPVDPRKLHPALPADLATICQKCLEPEASGRYPGAAALADDLARFLAGQPVLARPAGAAGQVWRWAKNNRALAALALAFLVSLVAGSTLVWRQATLNASQAEALRQEHHAARQLRAELSSHLYAADIRAAAQEIEASHPVGAWRWLQNHENDPARGIEWDWLALQARRQTGRVLHHGEACVTALAFSPDGQTLAGTDNQEALFLLNPASGQWQDTGARARLGSSCFLADGRVWYCGETTLESRALRADGSLGEASAGPKARQARLSANGRWAALCSARSLFYERGQGGTAGVYDTQARRLVWSAPERNVCHAAVNGDGSRLATAGRDGDVVLWDVSAGEALRRWQLPPVCALSFSADGQRLVAAGPEHAWVLNVRGDPAARALRHPRGHHVTGAAFSPDGGRVATACTDRVARVWSLDKPEEEALPLLGHESEVWCLAWSPDGSRLAGGGRDGRVLLWEAPQLTRRDNTFAPARYQRARFSPSGDSFLMASGEYPDLSLRRWRCADLEPLEEYPAHFQALGVTATDEALLWNLWYHRLEWWPRGAGEPARMVPLPEVKTDTMDQFAVSPTGKHLARLDNFGMLEIRPLTGGEPPRAARVFEEPAAGQKWTVRALAWSPDGRWLVACRDQPPHQVWLVDATTLAVTPLPAHDSSLTNVCFSPDGRWLAAGADHGDILVWPARETPGAAAIRLAAHTRSTVDVAFSRDSRTLLSLGGLDGVRFWHVETWRELAHLPVPDAFSHLSLSPDGGWLAVTCGERPRATRLRLFPLR